MPITSERRPVVGGVVRRLARWAVSVVVAVLVTTGLGVSVAGAAVSGVSFSAVVNGQPAASSSDAHPAQLYPTSLAEVRLNVSNRGDATARISTVRFEGQVLDLPLFSYDTAVVLVIPPGQTKSLNFPIVLTGVGSQATGLVGATITLLGPNGAGVASQTLVTNVHGSLRSIYGLFGLVVLLLTVSSLVLALLALARHTLSQNRWARGVRFFIPGFGVGLVLTFTLAVFHVFTPSPGHWLPLLLVPCVVGLALGFLTPAPNEEEFDDYDEDVLLAQIVVVDDDPLEGEDGGPGADVVTAAVGAPDGRSTTAPVSRPTTAPVSRPTRAPVTRPTSPPDSRPTADPVTRPTSPPDSRPTSAS
jgi:hypothetical protein